MDRTARTDPPAYHTILAPVTRMSMINGLLGRPNDPIR